MTKDNITVAFALIAYLSLALGSCALPFWLTKSKFSESSLARKLYRLSILSFDITLTGETIAKIGSYFLILLVLDVLLPAYLTWAIVILIAAKTSGFFSVGEITIEKGTEDAIAKLARAELEFLSAKNHLSNLNLVLLSSASDLQSKEKIKAALEADIAKKEEERAEWEKLSEEQKDYLIRKAHEYAPKRSDIRDWAFLLLGFGGNLVASAVWAWLGNPGKEQLAKYAHELFPLWLPF